MRLLADARAGEAIVAVLVGELREQFDVELRRIQILEQIGHVALLEMLDDVVEQRHGPRHAAFEQAEIERSGTGFVTPPRKSARQKCSEPPANMPRWLNT